MSVCVHTVVSDGLLARGGAYVPVAPPDPAALEELFRRLVIRALVAAQRLSEDFAQKLLSWRHSGFSVYARQVVTEDEAKRLKRLARYLTRPPLAQGRLRTATDGSLLLQTPPDPRTGAAMLRLDPLELIHRLTLQIPDPKQHLVRYYGAYANRARRKFRPADDGTEGRGTAGPQPDTGANPESEFTRERRKSWARLLRKLLEVDPLLCPDCRVEMKIVSVITHPVVIDAILRHVDQRSGNDPHAPRAPPAA